MDEFMRAGIADLRQSLSNEIDADKQLNKVLAKISSSAPTPRDQYAETENTTAASLRSLNSATTHQIKETAKLCLA
ncbi:hypothetical protein [Streptomyces mutomycini]|uniref:Uncharacterized protein n=1 Tax=Streptomyces mutomycini TaxID=284036 RepID=A0ABW0B681_9ACTN